MISNDFIGRKKFLKLLNENIFFPLDEHYGSCLSICGPHGIGKTYLLDTLRCSFDEVCLINDFQKNRCFYLEIDSQSGKNLINFQSDLLALFSGSIDIEMLDECLREYSVDTVKYRIAKKAVKNIKEAYSLPDKQPNKGAIGYDNWCAKISRSMQPAGDASVFYNFTLLGYRIIIIIDEFDRASTGYPTGDIFMWLFSLSNKSSTGLHINLSIVLSSRQRVNKIAHHMEESSNFEDAYPVYPLGGFNNTELNDYFASYAEYDKRELNDTQKRQILYLCGRHPGLLIKMRKFLSRLKYEDWNINSVWRNNSGHFKTVYSKMCTQLQNEKVSNRTDITLMDAVLYQFEFFTAEDKMFDELLLDSGYATAPDNSIVIIDSKTGIRYYQDIFVLTGEKSIENSLEPLKCEPLSPYFLEYIKRIWKPEQQKGVADYLELTERSFRIFIESRLQSKYPDTWKSVAESTLPNQKKIHYLERLQNTADINGYTGELSILDVMCFDNYLCIIKKNWDIFEPFFDGYGTTIKTPISQLSDDLMFLVDSRNTKAHGNIKILNSYQLEKVKNICGKLNAIILTSLNLRI